MAKANDRFFTWCPSIPRCKQQARGISPSVAPLNPLGAPAPSSEGAEAAPPQAAEFTLHSTGEPRSPLRFSRCSSRAQNIFAVLKPCSRCSSGAQIPISSAVLAPEELIQLSAADLALSRSKAMRAKRASRLSNFISGRTKESRNTKTFFP